ncbi:serine hydrolase domain-containing protein [Streptomyces beijiangensis]|uniref:Beta-lactamase family protein n=1 Tax=Streptomyces beijiangensis TaxID=163361 RepID=A0A939F650_9ACTN|nr:serine hydrolase domain-containing protein [Streptomyces beijiangensis]MBO0513291.1 beta-lactamase family protein [Streptomyces beijiangensis]
MAVRAVRAGLIGIAVAGALAATGFAAPAQAADKSADGRSDHAGTQAAMDAAVKDGVPGVAGQSVDKYGRWNGTSGVGSLKTGQPRSAHDRYRVGSITKTFVSTVLLQLEAEGKLDLDDKVEQWLPGVVHGQGHDGSRISVRQLLNHTSGIFDYTTDDAFGERVFSKEFLRHRYDTWTPSQLVRIAMGHRPTFEPGTSWSYSNTNYVLAGMIIKKVSGHGYADEIERRIIEPLGLRATSLPGTDASMPGPSSRAYSKLVQEPKPTDRTYDVTELNPSLASSAGELVSDSGDLNHFYSALLRGKLLPPAQLKEMKDTVPIEGAPNVGYGLGLMRNELSCGSEVWGHDGGIHGSSSLALTTADGRHSLALNFNGDWSGDSEAVAEAEFCPKQ